MRYIHDQYSVYIFGTLNIKSSQRTTYSLSTLDNDELLFI